MTMKKIIAPLLAAALAVIVALPAVGSAFADEYPYTRDFPHTKDAAHYQLSLDFWQEIAYKRIAGETQPFPKDRIYVVFDCAALDEAAFAAQVRGTAEPLEGDGFTIPQRCSYAPIGEEGQYYRGMLLAEAFLPEEVSVLDAVKAFVAEDCVVAADAETKPNICILGIRVYEGWTFPDDWAPGTHYGTSIEDYAEDAHTFASAGIPGEDYIENELILEIDGQTVIANEDGDEVLLFDEAWNRNDDYGFWYFTLDIPLAGDGEGSFPCTFKVGGTQDTSWPWDIWLLALLPEGLDIHAAIDALAQYPGVRCLWINGLLDPDIDEPVAAFADVDPSHWVVTEGWLSDVTERGLMKGWEENGAAMFGPDRPMTRAEAVTVLYRMANPSSVDTTDPGCYATENTTGLADVEPNRFYTAAVNWAVRMGVVRGYYDAEAGACTAFGPDDPVTREQMAVMAMEYIHRNDPIPCVGADFAGNAQEYYLPFVDRGDISEWARFGVSECVKHGIMTGYSPAIFQPQNCLTRAEAAKVFSKVFQMALNY